MAEGMANQRISTTTPTLVVGGVVFFFQSVWNGERGELSSSSPSHCHWRVVVFLPAHSALSGEQGEPVARPSGAARRVWVECYLVVSLRSRKL